jgi:protein-S-isoprenylcysteine O-methyltransferase Ste14
MKDSQVERAASGSFERPVDFSKQMGSGAITVWSPAHSPLQPHTTIYLQLTFSRRFSLLYSVGVSDCRPQVAPVRTLFLALRSLAYMCGFVVFFGWVALEMRALDQRIGIALPPWTAVSGIILMGLGGSIAVLCAGLFVLRGRGTPAIFDAPREFVALGPYRYVRNPMYIGGVTLLIGFGLYEQSVSILLLSLAVLVVLQLFIVFYEEPGLRRRFGLTYEEYCRNVPRWMPGHRTHST